MPKTRLTTSSTDTTPVNDDESLPSRAQRLLSKAAVLFDPFSELPSYPASTEDLVIAVRLAREAAIGQLLFFDQWLKDNDPRYSPRLYERRLTGAALSPESRAEYRANFDDLRCPYHGELACGDCIRLTLDDHGVCWAFEDEDRQEER